MKKTYPYLIDLHTDYVLGCYEKGEPYGSKEQINLPLLKKVNGKLIFCGFSYDDLLKDTDRQFEILLEQSRKDEFMLVVSKKDLKNLFSKNNSKIGLLLHLEGAEYLNRNIQNLYRYYENGLRSIGLTHAHQNSLAGGNTSDPTIPLTPFGREVVKAAHKLNMIVDLAHLNQKGFYECLEMNGSKPAFVSHTCVSEVCNNPRNLDDEQIKKIAETKGVMGIFFSSKYVKNDEITVTIDDVVKHFLHVADLIGTDNLAIGSDFGGITTGLPRGLENSSKLLDLFQKLKENGFTDEDINKIAYQNAQRVLLQILK
jgi:membrane dipeptidase